MVVQGTETEGYMIEAGGARGDKYSTGTTSEIAIETARQTECIPINGMK